jgi:Zn-dependent peptidase ImmA (M78 family)
MLEGEAAAITRAWDFQREAGITGVPVQIDKYLKVANADLRISSSLKDSEAGQTFAVGDRHIIVVNGRHSAVRQRFTVLHELAHIRLGLKSQHGGSISVEELLRYNRRPREEILCDVFASECLLPRQFFLPDARKRPCTFRSVEELAELYGASLAATGSRFAAYSEAACAWILADERRVRYVSSSPHLRQTGFFLKVGTEVPAQSMLGRLIAGLGGVTAGVADILPSHVWCSKDCGGIEEFTETAVLSSAYSQGLALLCAEDAAGPTDQSPAPARDEDEPLSELDGVLKFPGRRHRR